MQREKSCGAVLYVEENQEIHYLIIQYELNHNYWGFVKGHVEPGESEHQTAIREIGEEVGLFTLTFSSCFRHVHTYKINPHTWKQVVFFLAKSTTKTVILNKNEVKDSVWLPYQEAINQVTYSNDQELLAKANKILSLKQD